MINKELFTRDPETTVLPNDGVARVTAPQSQQEWDILRYELSTFVCEGEYQRGMERILATYLKHLTEAQQPAVWVSGFYGSGKSHLVRVLEYLWSDVEFPDKATARGLAHLPDDVKAHFQELTIQGRKHGGLWSAAGTLGGGAGESARLALLAIVFRSAGLPNTYPHARFVLWLKQNGYFDTVRAEVEMAGKDFDSEVRQILVSPVLARAVLAAAPSLANSEADLRQIFRAEYPPVGDVSNDEMVHILRAVLTLQSTAAGKLPLTLIVLDELQQYIGDNSDRTIRVQEVVEAISKEFGSTILLVGTGQSAMGASAQLSKLQARFTIRVQLSDRDVEQVVRQVALRKASDKEPVLKETLEKVSGEIDRHLPGTKIAPEAADRPVLAADYPLLPTRRRFWERALRALDRAGAAGQLRTQLRVVHEATRAVASLPVGNVVPGDFLYGQIAPQLLQTGALLRELNDIVQRQDDGTDDGRLRSRMAALIYLIGQLPTDGGADSGIRATADVLADLLVMDLNAGSAALRQRLPALLDQMADSGALLKIDSEYRLQTRESAEWESEYKGRFAKASADDGRIAADRTAELKTAVEGMLKGLAFPQGESKTPRKIDLAFCGDPPNADTGNVPVWVRDEWTVSRENVESDARSAGMEGAVVYVFLPRKSSDDLKKAIAGFVAAKETLQTKPAPTTADGIVARDAMRTRQEAHRREIDRLVGAVLEEARVYQGGGSDVAAADLRSAVDQAGWASLARLYPQFGAGDHAKWDTALKRAQDGNGSALESVGYKGEPDQHPVCKAVLASITSAGRKGVDIRKEFTAPPYGWPQDAVDAALLVLLHGNQLSARLNGTPVSVAALDRPKIAQAEFRREGIQVNTVQRIEVRKLLQGLGMNFKPNEEAVALPAYFAKLLELAKGAGGEKPLPAPPDTGYIEALQGLSGNEQVAAVYDARERLARDAAAWADARERIKERFPRWRTLAERLLPQAAGVSGVDRIQKQADAVRDGRQLLADPDPLVPLLTQLTDMLRKAITDTREAHLSAYERQIQDLEATDVWQKLSDSDQRAIRQAHDLGPVPEVKLGTPEELASTLDNFPLRTWEDRTAALAERVTRALLDATKRLEPKAHRITVPPATIKTTNELDAYLAKVREDIAAHLAAGETVVI